MSADSDSQKVQLGPSGRKIIYGADGKPCRSCNTLLDFRMATSGSTAKATNTTDKPLNMADSKPTADPSFNNGYPKDCPVDTLQLGRSTWTLLHTIAANYSETPTTDEQANLNTFIQSFSKLYPCWWCAKDFRKYIVEKKPKVTNRDEFGQWLCEAHNAVNIKTGKETFDCNLWKERWKDGWKDGSCE